MAKCQQEGSDFEESLFKLQNNPRTAEGFSPSHSFFSRSVRDPMLPAIYDGKDEAAVGSSILEEKQRRKKKKNEDTSRTDNHPPELKYGLQVLL